LALPPRDRLDGALPAAAGDEVGATPGDEFGAEVGDCDEEEPEPGGELAERSEREEGVMGF
jgi:hypothetical protein